MKYLINLIKVISVFLVFLILSGINFNTTGSDVPDWVKGKLPNYSDTLYGVGLANIGPNLVMARKKADDAARVDLAQKLSIKVKSVFENFAKESIDLLNPENNSSTEITTDVTKSVTEATLTNVTIVDRYKDDDNKIMYSLAVMSKTQIVNEIKDAVNQDSKNYFKEDKKLIALKKLDDDLDKWDLTN